MGEPSDETLMELCSVGDRAAFSALVRRHQAAVIRSLLRFVSDQATAEDLAQEVFLKIYRAAPNYRPTARFGTWLYRIVVHSALSYRRRRRPELREDLDERAAPVRGPEEEAAEERRREVIRAVDGLSENQRAALVLTRFEGLSYRETAEVLGVTLPAVESLVQRAYRSLREKLRAGFARSRS